MTKKETTNYRILYASITILLNVKYSFFTYPSSKMRLDRYDQDPTDKPQTSIHGGLSQRLDVPYIL